FRTAPRGQREGRISGFNAQPNRAAYELQAAVAHQRARKQAGFRQNLKAVANTEHQAALRGELLDGLHHRRELCKRSAAQVIAVSEAARKDHGIDITELRLIVPEELRLLSENSRDRVPGVVVAVASREDDDSEFHRDTSILAETLLP